MKEKIKRIIEKIKDIFSLHCPECGGRMKSLDIYKLVEDWETGQLIPIQKVKDKIEEYKNEIGQLRI